MDWWPFVSVSLRDNKFKFKKLTYLFCDILIYVSKINQIYLPALYIVSRYQMLVFWHIQKFWEFHFKAKTRSQIQQKSDHTTHQHMDITIVMSDGGVWVTVTDKNTHKNGWKCWISIRTNTLWAFGEFGPYLHPLWCDVCGAVGEEATKMIQNQTASF